MISLCKHFGTFLHQQLQKVTEEKLIPLFRLLLKLYFDDINETNLQFIKNRVFYD